MVHHKSAGRLPNSTHAMGGWDKVRRGPVVPEGTLRGEKSLDTDTHRRWLGRVERVRHFSVLTFRVLLAIC